MPERFIRTEAIFGNEAMEKLKNAKILIFGIGGVGGLVMDALVRSGVGTLGLVDNDTISLSNLNRQIIATTETLGLSKTDAALKHIACVNPACNVQLYNTFYTPECTEIPFNAYDYIVDAIDTVTSKIDIIEKARQLKIPVISSMGTGNKTDPTKLCITDIEKTSVCPLARVMRRELRKRNIRHIKVLFSTEEPTNATVNTERTERHVPGSFMPVPATAGLIIASEVIKDIIRN